MHATKLVHKRTVVLCLFGLSFDVCGGFGVGQQGRRTGGGKGRPIAFDSRSFCCTPATIAAAERFTAGGDGATVDGGLRGARPRRGGGVDAGVGAAGLAHYALAGAICQAVGIAQGRRVGDGGGRNERPVGRRGGRRTWSRCSAIRNC